MKPIKILLTSILIMAPLFSQKFSISGTIVDENGIPLSGANIFIQDANQGGSSANDGKFILVNVPYGSHTIIINVIGYKQQEIKISRQAGTDVYDLGVIQLQPLPIQSKTIVVTASKYKQNLTDVPASMSIISKDDFNYRNTITIDEALQYTPGITMNQSQVNIRGSNGYSYGVGSRVMMLVDGVPYLTGDTQEANFESIPLNQIERIEIVKGAGSALYGSNAMGGVINIISRDISPQPQLGIRMYGGFYEKPFYHEWRWSDQTRYFQGLKISYSQQIKDLGISLLASRDLDDSYKKNDWKRRSHFGSKFQYDFSPSKRLTVSTAYMDQKRGNFIYWEDLRNALIPDSSQLGQKIHSIRYHLTSTFRQVISDRSFYKISGIWFHNQFDDNIKSDDFPAGNESSSDFFNFEFQYTRKMEKHTFTSGISGSYNNIESNMFGNHGGRGIAAYLQDEITVSNQWIATAGTRYDYFEIESASAGYQINPKIGIIFKPLKTTSLRSSCGTGYRGPSVAEAFTSTSITGLTVIPNTRLDPEKSISFELGYNQFWSSYIVTDLALFYNEYWDLIEGTIIPASNNIQFQNIAKARIYGYEFNLTWQIVPDKIDCYLGYTYVEPRDLSKDDYLSFRPRHLLHTGCTFRYSICKLGFDYRYISRYDRIDLFEQRDDSNIEISEYIDDADVRTSAHVLDLRLSADLKIADKNVRTSFQINNLFQYHYTDLIASISPIRNYVLTLDWIF
jgi:outer membrane receptor for ferrienterochelin and colicins